MSDPRLPSDIDERAIDPPVCEQCQISENRIGDMQDALSDAVELLNDFEETTRIKDFGATDQVAYRKALSDCIARCKRLA
jgi:hypothetical protein